MTLPVHLLSILLPFFVTCVRANTEKAIFLGPEPVDVNNIPIAHSALSDLHLHTLTPINGTIRTGLTAQFPSPDHPHGIATWLLLDHLTPNQRYEVRVCWAATQPTAFSLDTFPLATVRDSPDLMASLHAYSASRQSEAPLTPKSSSSREREETSMILLRILAAADYFTTDAALMSNVPPVDVDIILDPFLLNALPRSLAGTACYIVIVAVVAFFLARRIASWIQGLAAGSGQEGRSSGRKKRQ